MRRHTRDSELLALLLVAVLALLASCGGAGSSQQEESEPGNTQASHEKTTGGMAGMEMESGETAPADLIIDGEYSDERFIDMMAAHHQMAIEMAQAAQQEAQLPQIRQIAVDVIAAQQAEIEELRNIKEREFGSSELPTAMNPEDPAHKAMLMPDQLEQQDSFDLAFIDSMIPHHASAIEMASTALLQSENTEIKDLSRRVVDAQSREIGQLIELRQQNYPEARSLT